MRRHRKDTYRRAFVTPVDSSHIADATVADRAVGSVLQTLSLIPDASILGVVRRRFDIELRIIVDTIGVMRVPHTHEAEVRRFMDTAMLGRDLDTGKDRGMPVGMRTA
ncbi:hypothetical protein GCM10009560_77070 [Nonomuraea longicatena]|uniref:Uncharacterized protein n=1 Tax=Nonomuraea longicatena TaxID=83682 RepID=A0ABP4BUF5_9ACTN